MFLQLSQKISRKNVEATQPDGSSDDDDGDGDDDDGVHDEEDDAMRAVKPDSARGEPTKAQSLAPNPTCESHAR